MADGSVKIEITGDDSDIKKKVQDTEDSLKGLGDKQKETQKETEKTSSKFEELANAIDKQEKELKDLKAEYIETAINLGKNSSEAQALKEKFSTLSIARAGIIAGLYVAVSFIMSFRVFVPYGTIFG